MLHMLLLSADLFNSGQLLVPEVFCAEIKLLSFPITTFASSFTIGIVLCKALLLLTTALHHLVVILVLQILQLSCLLTGLINFLNSP